VRAGHAGDQRNLVGAAKSGDARPPSQQLQDKVFFGNDCPQTSRYFEEIGGNEDRQVTSVHYQRVAAPPRFRLPNHEFVAPGNSMITSHAVDTRKQPRFSGAELGGLPNGTALVEVALVDDSILLRPELLTPSRVSDLYLLALAAANESRLATFDRRIPATAVAGGPQALEIIPV